MSNPTMILLRFTPQGCTVRSPEPVASTTPGSGRLDHGYAVAGGKAYPSRNHRLPPEAEGLSFRKTLSYPEGGTLSQIVWTPDRLEILTDHSGAFPIYAATSGEAWILGSDAWEVAREAGLSRLDPESCMDLLAFEYVLGNRTLIEGLEELPMGSRVRIEKTPDGLRRIDERDWEYRRELTAQGDENARLDAAEENLREVCRPIRDFVRDTDGPLALNLSGGWDSRALLANFAPLGEKKLFTCTYGSGKFNGVKIARNLSRSLNIPNRFYDFPNGTHLRRWFDELCRFLPPVVRFNLGDGGYAVSTTFYGDATAATCGHNGDAWTKAPFDPSKTLGTAEELGQWVDGRWGNAFSRPLLRHLLRSDRCNLADAPSDHARETARTAFESSFGGAIRWRFEQRARRLVCVEVRILERAVPMVFLPMMDRNFLSFWGEMPDADLVGQRLYRTALATRVFQGDAEPLRRLGREGGGLLGEPTSLLGRIRSKTRQRWHSVGRRVFPAATCEATIADPTVTWWHRDPELRAWAWDTLSHSEVVTDLFDRVALERFVKKDTLRTFNLACIGIWNLLTLAGVERVLHDGIPESPRHRQTR